MDSELKELYQQVILDHNKNPRNFRKIENANHFAEGYNPLCGDKINIYAEVVDGKIIDISFQGSGCAISKASASIMSSMMKGLPIEEAQSLFNNFLDVITGRLTKEEDLEGIGKLAVFSGVRDFPSRVKCASLAWHTLDLALKKDSKTISTE